MPSVERPASRRRPWYEARGLVAVPLVLIVVITTVNLATPGHPHVGPLLIVAPVLAAVTLGPWLTTLTGVLALADQVIFAVLLRDLHSAQRVAQIFAVVAASAFAALLSGMRERKVRELTRVRQVSEIAQNLVLRPLPPRMGPLRVAAVYLAAEREMKIGGDLYAAARTAHGTRLLIGDVRGKGLTAVSDAALLLSAFRGAAHRQTGLAEFTAYLDASVCWNLAEPGENDLAQECFVTAILIDIPDHAPTVQIVHCGHPPPLRLRPGQATALCAHQAGPPLGLQLDTPGHCVDTFDFGQGDLLLLYTDGVAEARNPRGDFYPLAERAATWRGERPEKLLEHLRSDLLAHAGGRLDDDAAMIALERPAGSGGLESRGSRQEGIKGPLDHRADWSASLPRHLRRDHLRQPGAGAACARYSAHPLPARPPAATADQTPR